MTTPTEWRERSGETLSSLAGKLGVCERSLIRYFAEERAWPFAIALALKKLSGDVLTDESFSTAKRMGRSPTRAHKRLSTCNTQRDQAVNAGRKFSR